MKIFKIQFIAFLLLLSFNAIAQNKEASNSDYLNKEFHKKKREEFRKLMPENSVAVFFANSVKNRSNDVYYIYHQDPDLYYLTGYREPNAALIIFKEDQKNQSGEIYNEVLFVQPRNPMQEMWNGKRLGIDGAKTELGFDLVYENVDFQHFPINYSRFSKVFFKDFKNDALNDPDDDGDVYSLIEFFKLKAQYPVNYNPEKYRLYELIRTTEVKNSANVAQVIDRYLSYYPRLKSDNILNDFRNAENNKARQKVAKNVPETNLDGYSVEEALNAMRETKTDEEIKLLRKAIAISCVGQIEVMKTMHLGMSEREIQGIHEFVYKKYGAEYEGYPSIVGAGNNGCILHYIENEKQTVGNELVLMDLGAQYRGYTADVTRTIPATGKFSPEQKAIYDLVYEAQEAGFKKCRVGSDFNAPHKAAEEVISKGLKKLGIIKNELEAKQYFPHGTSHYLGLDVHDRGTYGKFKAGTVITVEPGIYIPEGSDCDPKWWGIAVRIEDDILITERGYENLSSMAPRKSEEIEAMMQKESVLNQWLLPELD
jgi:Xaa-Pro aminopeptidase